MRSSGGDLSDSELRIQLMGAAQMQRDEQVASIGAAAKKGRQARRRTGKKRGTARKKAENYAERLGRDKEELFERGRKGQRERNVEIARGRSAADRLADELFRESAGQEGNLTKRQEKKLRQQKRLGSWLEKRTKLIEQAPLQEKMIRAADRSLVAEQQFPLFERAREIGIEALPDEPLERIFGVVGPKEEAQWRNAETSVLKYENPEFARIVGKVKDVSAPEAARIMSSPRYAALAAAAEDALAQGGTKEEFTEGLRELLLRGGGQRRQRAQLGLGKGRYERMFKLVVAEYGDQFPSVTESERRERRQSGAQSTATAAGY